MKLYQIAFSLFFAARNAVKYVVLATHSMSLTETVNQPGWKKKTKKKGCQSKIR